MKEAVYKYICTVLLGCVDAESIQDPVMKEAVYIHIYLCTVLLGCVDAESIQDPVMKEAVYIRIYLIFIYCTARLCGC